MLYFWEKESLNEKAVNVIKSSTIFFIFIFLFYDDDNDFAQAEI
jgi:hypothetical protein